ncbi:MAG: Ribosomal large subunit pseudouridine synthase D [Elusimicrobia bacterium ADurb.Bin231]|nr:MAG: Ribosomal large subunit pseudouridine synthase D [Elusimicrobia bacterium ADurb.Bin231]
MDKIVCEQDRIRLDRFLKEKYPDYSRGYFQRLIKNGFVNINDKYAESGHKLRCGDCVNIQFTAKEQTMLPSDIPLNIIYEDDSIIAINKQPNLVVHPAGSHKNDTLVNGLIHYWNQRLFPFLVHRLDKDTSGIIIAAKDEKSKEILSKQFQNRTVKKKYIALVDGVIKEKSGVIEAPLGRSSARNRKIIIGPMSKKAAETLFSVKKRSGTNTLLEVTPLTGRTHQIRVHMAFIGHPITGDAEYGKKSEIVSRQMLHAYEISFMHPGSGKRVTYKAPLPEDFQEVLRKMDL